MRISRRLGLLGLLSGLAMATATSANAQMLVEDWTLDLNAVPGANLPFQVNDITTIDVTGASSIARATLIGPNPPGPGATYRIAGLVRVEGFLDSGGAASGVTGGDLNGATTPGGAPCAGCYEVTGIFDINVTLSAGSSPDVLLFTNEGGGNLGGGVGLRLFVDNLEAGNPDGGQQSDRVTGLGYTDGTEIASFRQLAGDGGAVIPGIQQGTTESNFELVSALPGVLLDNGGMDLSLLTDDLIAFLTEQILLSTPNGQDFNVPGPTDATSPIRADFPVDDPTVNPNCAGVDPFSIPDGSTGCISDFYVILDPSAQLFELPEPTTLGVMGMGLLGLGLALRRRRKVAA